MSKPENLPGNDSIRPGQLDPGPLTAGQIHSMLERMNKIGQAPLVWAVAMVYETRHYSLAADMYREVIRGVISGRLFHDMNDPSVAVRGVQVLLMYVNNSHYIQVFGVAEKLPGVEP